ncbi:MAG: GbsR/MarR family transcriptional regulator [Candidatus Hermodarchaeota archaeon]
MASSKKEKDIVSDIQKLEEEISNFFEDLMYDWGGSPLLGRIYALCVLTKPTKNLQQKDLVDRFKVNPSTISRNLKELESWRLIARRREPGSREWKYQVQDTSFFDLVVHRFEVNALSLRERLDDLVRIRNHWGKTLSEESKKNEKGRKALSVLDQLTEWIKIVDKELDGFIQKLHTRFLELEQKFEKV